MSWGTSNIKMEWKLLSFRRRLKRSFVESFLLGLSFLILYKGSQAGILIKVHVSVNAIPIAVVMNLEKFMTELRS